ncbi:SET domain-containing protein 5 [Apiospora arundinis]
MGRIHTIFTLLCVPLTQVYCQLLQSPGEQHDGQFLQLASSTGSFCPWHRDSLDLTPEWVATERSPLELIPGSCVGNVSKELCAYLSPAFADSQGIAFVTSPQRAARLAQSTSLTDPLVHSQVERLNVATNPKWEMRHIPGKGMGVIATSHLNLGDHIMTSTPALVLDNGILDYSDDEATELRAQAIKHLPPALRSSFLKLTTHDDVTTMTERIDKIVEVNSFELDTVGDVQDDEGEMSWLAVFPDISRLNHACRPNAQYYFDPLTMTQNVHAVRDIYPGEEITVSYINAFQSYRRRQERIHDMWHFGCTCDFCSKNSHQIKASDERLRQITKLLKDLHDHTRLSKATPQTGELLISLYRQEKLWYAMYEAYTLAALEYNFVGDAKLAIMHASLAFEHGLASAGPNDENIVSMRMLMKDPRRHWSWMYRINKREGN